MLKKTTGSILLLGFLAASISHASAATYHYRYPIEGVKASSGSQPSEGGSETEPLLGWAEFADSYTPDPLFYPSDWSSIDWSAKGIAELPDGAYPSTTPGDINLSGNQITSISGMDNIVSAGNMYFYNNQISSPSLASLETAGVIHLAGNSIGELDGMNNLASVGSLVISGAGITHFSGLNGLKEFTSNANPQINLNSNPLIEVSGGNGFETTGSAYYTTKFIQIGNTSLEAFSGFNSLETVSNMIVITYNSNFTTLSGFQSLTTAYDLNLSHNNLQSITGLGSLTTVSSDLNLSYNDLQDISGLSSLASVGGDLRLFDNPNLVDLSAIQNISSAGMIMIDDDISSRPGFVKLPSTAPICQPEMTDSFHNSYALQSDICL